MIKKMCDAEYFSIDAVSNSLLGRLAKCPAAINVSLEPTPSMLLGTLAHCLILEGRSEFGKRYVVAPDCDRRTKEGKALYQSFCEANDGKTIITLDQLQTVAGMAESVANHPACQELLSTGEPEIGIFWDDEGVDCKAKADWLSSDCLIDLKTTQNSEYSMFSKTIVNSGYYRQMAMYRHGLRQNSIFPEHCLIIAVETKAPYTVNVYEVCEDLLEAGEGQYKHLLRKYVQIKDLEVLPAYTEAGVQEVRCPAWMKEAGF